MRIQELGVTELFGVFNHTVPLHSGERITIMYGLNGVGKTVLLRMLVGLASGKYGVFRRVPFGKFTVRFDDGSSLNVHTEADAKPRQLHFIPGKGQRSVVLAAHYADGTAETYVPSLAPWDRDRRRVFERIEALVPFLTRVGSHSWRHDRTNQLFDYDEVIERFGDALQMPDEEPKEPPRLHELRRSVHVHLIHTQRLEIPDEEEHLHRRRDTSSSTLTVERYSRHLVKTTGAVLEQYAAVSQKLDRDFPFRLFRADTAANPTVPELREQLVALEAERANLKRLGFLDLEQAFTVVPDEVISTKRDVFSIYVKDNRTKLAVFQDVARKVELLTTIINDRFQYKKLSVSRDKGFLFTSKSGDILQPADLSSGEQHELVLAYELIFNLKENSLVLIDEPEISLHIVWQQQFLSDLRKIVELSAFDVLIATHSPQIIGDHWDLTVELAGPAS